MKLGAFEIFPLSDGRFRLDGGAMFGVVPRVLWERCCPADPLHRIELALTCLLIHAHGRYILVDTGIGDKWPATHRDMFGIERKPTLVESLAAHGLHPKDIHLVIQTHLHFDHAGGNTVRVDAGLVPTFPNALYAVQRGEYRDASKPNERTKASYRAENIEPLEQVGRWELLDGDTELLPGLSVVVTGGHTAHHQAVKVESDGQVALFLGDLIPTTAHLPLPYIMGYDLFPVDTLEAKRRILQQGYEEQWWFCFEHDPHIQMSRVTRNSEGGFELLNRGA